MSVSDRAHMAHALRLAECGLHTTDPNPRVGCVIVRDGEVVGTGWHRRAGEPHAEIHALHEAGERARGATVYLTLEPCCHHGRTPPCSEALLRAGVARVVAAMEDPNPRVAGQGLAQLAASGAGVESGLLREQAEALNPGFLMRMRHGRPYVRCKLAMSLDGRTAMGSGESKWVTGEAARADVQRLRARSSAVLTGIGTVLADDPSLDVRLPGVERQPLRVIADPRLRTPETARMLQIAGRSVILTCAQDPEPAAALTRRGAEVVRLPACGERLDLHAAMRWLAGEEVNEVLLEAGATLAGAMLQAGLIDELVVYMAPHLMGDGAHGLLRLPGLERMEQRVALEILDIRAVGEDWRITARPQPVAP
jgi:diaminohydroxyphosphoribosylaminopyrimidine deaminase / 5-amino-6-(5-phosphoribosylamino)uracil reductase